jgi:Protein of unknown function (DUF4446)
MQSLSPFLNFITEYPSIPLGIAVLLLLTYTAHLHHKIYRFTRGQTSLSLEELMKACVDGVAKIEERNELISKHALLLDEKITHAIRNVETTRYKAFETNGSNQSFSIALVNEKGNGVIISTLHAHDRVSTFAKPIENYGSTYELTEEELSVLREAKSKHKLTSKINEEEE